MGQLETFPTAYVDILLTSDSQVIQIQVSTSPKTNPLSIAFSLCLEDALGFLASRRYLWLECLGSRPPSRPDTRILPSALASLSDSGPFSCPGPAFYDSVMLCCSHLKLFFTPCPRLILKIMPICLRPTPNATFSFPKHFFIL